MTTDVTQLELPPALAAHTGYLLHRSHLHAAGIAALEFPAGRHPRQVAVLGVLVTQGPCSQSELAQRLGVNRTVMVKLIDELEDAGLVERRRNADDRRSYALHPTRDGLRALEELQPHAHRSESTLTARLEPDERRRLNDLLRALLLSEAGTLPESLSDRTGFLITKAHFRHRAIGDAAFAPLGIDVRDFGVLTALSTGAYSQQELARQFGVSGTIVVQVIDGLERRGLVERRRNPSDRRSYALRLTDAGRALQARARAVLARITPDLVSAIGEEGDRELAGLLRKLLLGVSEPAADGGAVAERAAEAGPQTNAGRAPSPPEDETPPPAT